MQAVKTLNEHENFIAKCLFYTLLLHSTCSLLLLREDAQPKEWICWCHKKTKAGEEFHGPLRKFDEATARFVAVGISTTGFILGTGLSNRNTQAVQADFTICLIG